MNDVTSIRLSEETRKQIATLARVWGPVKPLTMTDVVTACVQRVYQVETKTKKKDKRK